MREGKWMIPIVIFVVIALAGLAVIGSGAVYEYLFPMAAPIDCPSTESVASMILIRDNNTSATVETADFGALLHNISNAQPTRIWSIYDYPVEKSYYTMEIDTSEREYRYFIYVENAKVYIESPYEGVYQADQQILDLVEQRFKD